MGPASVALAVLALLAVTCAPLTVRAEAGGITRDSSTFPNYWWDNRQTFGTASYQVANEVSMVPDPARGLVIELNGTIQGGPSSGIPNTVVYRASSGTIVNKAYLTAMGYTAGANTGEGEQSKEWMGTFDATDGVLVYYDGFGTVHLVSEATLKEVGRFPAPIPPQDVTSTGGPPMVGLSWSSAHDELVLSSAQNINSGTIRPLGFIVYDYDVGALLHGHYAASWSDAVGECSAPLPQVFATATAQRSDLVDAVYVPCQLATYVANASTDRGGVVRLELSQKRTGATSPTSDVITCDPAAKTCPDGVTVVAAAPGAPQDFIFDPAVDRGLMPVQSQATGVDALVYDGSRATFLGKVNVGDPADYNGIAFGLDTERGRLYAIGRDDGMTVVDSRRTPVEPGGRYATYRGSINYIQLATLPPDPAHAATRLLVPFFADTRSDPYCPQCQANDFTVFDDAQPVSQDPPPAQDDANTYAGPIPPGSSLLTTYSGHARGYGVHVDVVGGSEGLATNVEASFPGAPGVALPLGSTADLLAGSVDSLSLSDGSPLAGAAALADANGQASASLQECSNALALTGCTAPPQCPPGVSCPTVPQVPVDESTGQSWPFPDALCAGGQSSPDSVSSGVYLTSPYTSAQAPAQSAVPGTDAVAHAEVHCTATQPVAGTASGASSLHALDLSLPGLTRISVAGAFDAGMVIPPKGAGEATRSRSTAVAQGIHVDLGDGDAVDIGGVTQAATSQAAGRPGTSRTTDTVLVQHVVVTQGGQAQELCGEVCPDVQLVVGEINATFPTLIHVMTPVADDSLGDGAEGNGSPGGYKALVQANLTEQYGDRTFNYMSKSESTYLPALRIVIYGPNDGSPSFSRTVVDVAGVEDDSEDGISVLAPESGFGDGLIAAVEAGAGLPGAMFIPGMPAATGTAATGAAGTNYGPGVVGLVRRVLSGLRWLAHSPLEAITLLATFALLGTPLVLIARRRLWLTDAAGYAR